MILNVKCKNRIKRLTMFIFMALSLHAHSKPAMTLEEAADFVRDTSKGKVLSAKTSHSNGESTHRIQVLTPSGRIKIYQIPAEKKQNYRPQNDIWDNKGSEFDRQNYRGSGTQKYENPRSYQPQRPQQERPNRYRPTNPRERSDTNNKEKKDK